MIKYSTQAVIDKITDIDLKKEEEAKVLISSDSYAICEFLENLRRAIITNG